MTAAGVASATEVLDDMRAMGFEYFTGVPCSFLTPLINAVIASMGSAYIRANQEGEALAISAGLWCAGKRCMTLSQNSGLGNMVNPITSLLEPFGIPAALMLTWRGRPGIHDEPQHALMGAITPDLLKAMRIKWHDGAGQGFEWGTALRAVNAAWLRRDTSAIVLDGESFAATPSVPAIAPAPIGTAFHDLRTHKQRPTRQALLEVLLAKVSDRTAIVANTGKCARELFALEDRAQHFYMTGSMGFAGALGLGVSIGRRERVIALDGDGALLMRMGNLATIGSTRAAHFTHILLDNECHDSTGGQPTASGGVDFCAIAAACGYRHNISVDSPDSFARALDICEGVEGPIFLHARMRPGSMKGLPRPEGDFRRMAMRFREFCGHDFSVGVPFDEHGLLQASNVA